MTDLSGIAAIAGAAGATGETGMTAGNLIGGIIFGSIGFAAFMYGKKSGSWKPMIIGVVLMVFPYAIKDTLGLYLTGALITASLFIFRD